MKKLQSRKKEPETSKQERATHRNTLTISYYLAAVAIAIVAFVHIYLPVEPPEVVMAVEAHQEVKNARNDYKEQLIALTTDYNNGAVSTEDFEYQLPGILENYNKYKEESEQRFSALNETLKENEILGFSGWQTFLASFANPFVICCLSVFLFVGAFSERRKYLKQAKFLLASTACVIGCFFLTWVFVTLPDLPLWSYVSAMLVCALLATAGVRYVTQWLYFRRASVAQFRKIIKLLIDFIAIDVRDKYLKKEKEEEYINDTFKTLEKGLE